METSGQAFDALGRILSEGGDIALAHTIAQDNRKGEADLLALWLIWGANDSDIAVVRGIAEDAVEAAESINGLGPDDPIDLSLIPVNPQLFGIDPAGRRIYASADFYVPGVDHPFRMDFQLPDLMRNGELLEYYQNEALRRIKASPRAFGITEEEAEAIVAVDLKVIIRRF